MNLSLKSTYEASSHVCCVETPRFAANVLSLGLYELEDGETQLRNGKTQILSTSSFESHSHIDFPCGVLDMKWKQRQLACALSDGSVSILSCNNQENIIAQQDKIESENEGFALSIDWNHTLNEDVGDILAVSTQQGSVHIYQLTEAKISRIVTYENMHQLGGEVVPAWITAQSTMDTYVLLSGGDDACMRVYDTRSELPIHTYRRSHTAGVTSAQWHPQQDIFATGSYDGFVRIWDMRMLRSVVTEHDTGGGVWRLKWGANNLLLAACMHAGAFILNIDGDSFSVVSSMVDDDKDRLVYGADWLDDGVAISSFYRDVVQIWR